MKPSHWGTPAIASSVRNLCRGFREQAPNKVPLDLFFSVHRTNMNRTLAGSRVPIGSFEPVQGLDLHFIRRAPFRFNALVHGPCSGFLGLAILPLPAATIIIIIMQFCRMHLLAERHCNRCHYLRHSRPMALRMAASGRALNLTAQIPGSNPMPPSWGEPPARSQPWRGG